MRSKESKEDYIRITQTADENRAKNHYEDDPNSHLSGVLMIASEFLREPKNEEAFCKIMRAILSKDYIDPGHVKRYLDTLRERSDSRINLLDSVWAGVQESRES